MNRDNGWFGNGHDDLAYQNIPSFGSCLIQALVTKLYVALSAPDRVTFANQ